MPYVVALLHQTPIYLSGIRQGLLVRTDTNKTCVMMSWDYLFKIQTPFYVL